MAGLTFPLLSEIEKINERFRVIFEECSEKNMSEDEIWRHIWDNNLIPLQHTLSVFHQVFRTCPELFIACVAKIRERNAQPLRNPPNVQRYAAAASPQEANAVYPSTPAASSQVPQEAATALENQNLQTSQQQPAYPNDFWQQILTTLGQIRRNTDQIVKLLTDGHGFGPHPSSAAGSLKRQRAEDAEERCNSDEAAKLQEKEEGDDEESEKLQ